MAKYSRSNPLDFIAISHPAQYSASFAKKTNWGQMARLMSVHRSGVPLAYLRNFGNGGDGLLKGEKGNSGADVTSLLYAKHSTQNMSGKRALERPLEFETAPPVRPRSLQTICSQ